MSGQTQSLSRKPPFSYPFKWLKSRYYDISDLKVTKKNPFTRKLLEDFFRLLPERADSERSWSVTRKAIEAKNYDLKAVNPNARSNADTRTPDELLDLIEAKGREVAEALAQLRRHR